MTDLPIRLAAFHWLEAQTARHGDVLPWPLLLEGFTFDTMRVPLVSMQGIFTPRICELPLTLRTSPDGPYDDAFAASGVLLYRYRGTDPFHRDNLGLREAMRRQVPLIYLHGHRKGRYHALWPVFVTHDDPAKLTFTVQADDAAYLDEATTGPTIAEDTTLRRRYLTVEARKRLHQDAFRERVLEAYHEQCALCRLRHEELLDAAHIDPDSSPEGAPVVSNGLALCKLHHAAFDKYVLTVEPDDYRVLVRRDVLEEHDGPMLRHGLQELHERRIYVPRKEELRPDRGRLAGRLVRFRTG